MSVPINATEFAARPVAGKTQPMPITNPLRPVRSLRAINTPRRTSTQPYSILPTCSDRSLLRARGRWRLRRPTLDWSLLFNSLRSSVECSLLMCSALRPCPSQRVRGRGARRALRAICVQKGALRSRPGRDELRLSACDWQVAERGLLLHLHHATTSPLITEPVMIAADWPRVTAQYNCTQIARGARRAPPPRTCCEGGVGCSAAHINSEHSTLERKELNRSDRAGVGLRSLHRPRASKRLRSLHVGRMLYGCLDVHRGVLMARS